MARTQTSRLIAAAFGEAELLLHPTLTRHAVVLQVCDALTIPICGAVTYYYLAAESAPALVPFILGTILVLAAMRIAKCYDVKNVDSIFIQCTNVIVSWILGIFMLIAFVFFVGDASRLSTIWIFCWLVSGISASIMFRCGAVTHFDRQHRGGRLALNIAVIGSPLFGEYITKKIREDCDERRLGVRLIGVFALGNWAAQTEYLNGEKTVEDLLHLARTTRIDEVIVQLPNKRGDDFHSLLRKLSEIPSRVSLCPDLSDLPDLSELSAARRLRKGAHARSYGTRGSP
jgi:FlaA1/EpsC-like NDP-sugar epimerase